MNEPVQQKSSTEPPISQNQPVGSLAFSEILKKFTPPQATAGTISLNESQPPTRPRRETCGDSTVSVVIKPRTTSADGSVENSVKLIAKKFVNSTNNPVD